MLLFRKTHYQKVMAAKRRHEALRGKCIKKFAFLPTVLKDGRVIWLCFYYINFMPSYHFELFTVNSIDKMANHELISNKEFRTKNKLVFD